MLRLGFLALAGFAILAAPVVAKPLPAPTASYSATATYTIGKDHYTSTVFANGANERRVVDTELGPQIVIIKRNEGKAYLLQPAIGALEMPLSSKEIGVDVGQLFTTTARPAGTETISGLKTTKYRLTAQPATNTKFTGTVWATDDGIIVKVDGTGSYRGQPTHVAMALSDVKRGDQPVSSFELPRDTRIIPAGPLVKQLLE